VSEEDLQKILQGGSVSPWRISLARWVESPAIQRLIILIIILNAAILGMETSQTLMENYGPYLVWLDKTCLAIFVVEIAIKLVSYRWHFWRNGWNLFDFFVVAIALIPAAGPWSILRALRVLRILRLFTMVPALRKVVAAFLHAIPGLSGVILVMLIFFYVGGVLSTRLFGETFPQWFGTLGQSLFSLFQVMTLESWSMGLVRPIMEVHPWAWAFFVPFIVIATFTILNLFIGIIVSTMQELSIEPSADPKRRGSHPDITVLISRMEADLAELKRQIEPPARSNTSPEKGA
jgi:voltage-gated sodium channel